MVDIQRKYTDPVDVEAENVILKRIFDKQFDELAALEAASKQLGVLGKKGAAYNPSQPRDEGGQWTSTGGVQGTAEVKASVTSEYALGTKKVVRDPVTGNWVESVVVPEPKLDVKGVVDSYTETGRIKLPDSIKSKLKTIISDNTVSTSVLAATNDFYAQVINGRFKEFHEKSKADWEDSSSSKLALALKDSVSRQFGGEIQYHGNVISRDTELKKIYKKYPKQLVDDYVKVQHDLTRAYLDEMYPDTDKITLYRGTTRNELVLTGYDPATSFTQWVSENPELKARSNSLSSWSLKIKVADKFAKNNNGLVLETTVSKDDIWSTFMSHAYEGREREMLITSNKDRVVDVIADPEYYMVETGKGAAFNPGQPRNPDGTWTDTGGVSELSPTQKQHVMDKITPSWKVTAEIKRKYQDASYVEPHPVAETEMISRVKKVKELHYDLTKNTEVVMLPFGSKTANGWTDQSDDEDKIYIPQEDAGLDVEKMNGFKAYTRFLIENNRDLRSNVPFLEWVENVQTLTPEDQLEKIILHEQGHRELIKKLDELDVSGIGEARYYIQNPTRLLTIMDDYSKDISVVHTLNQETKTPAERAYLLGEIIAEDWRLMKAPDSRQAIFPHRYLGIVDWNHPGSKERRTEKLKKVLKW